MKKVILSQLILITSILISCTDKLENTEVNNNPTNQVVLTSNEYASIAYDNPKELSEDEITNVIYDFKRINSEFKKQFITTKEDKPKISIINKYYLTNSRNHSRSADSIQINVGEFYQFNLSSCIRQQNSLTAQFVSFSLSNLANIFYPPPIFTIINLCLL